MCIWVQSLGVLFCFRLFDDLAEGGFQLSPSIISLLPPRLQPVTQNFVQYCLYLHSRSHAHQCIQNPNMDCPPPVQLDSSE